MTAQGCSISFNLLTGQHLIHFVTEEAQEQLLLLRFRKRAYRSEHACLFAFYSE